MVVRRNQRAVLWSFSGTDKFGQPTFAAAVEIAVRWEDRQEVFVDPSAKEVVSRAVVYPEQAVTVQSILYLGTLASLSSQQKADPLSFQQAFVVRGRSSVPNVPGTFVLEKVWL